MRFRFLQLIPFAILLAFWLATFISRPLLPVDETRYATVAWEMWNNGNLLVPHLNGQPYSHKPPLLFWLINAGWLLMGVSEWWARLVPALFALGSLGMLRRLANDMWPQENSAVLAPLIFAGCLGVAFFSTALRFDMLMVFFVLAALVYLWRFIASGNIVNWIGVGVMTGLAILSKGPVAFVYLLPGILLAPWWLPPGTTFSPRHWYGGFALAVVFILATVGLWLIPTFLIADPDYLRNILVTQTSARITGELGHQRPIWFYLPWLTLFLLPWILWPPFWLGLVTLWRSRSKEVGQHQRDAATRLLALTLVVDFLFFSLIGSKHSHYLLPDIALVSLLIAHAVSVGVPAVNRPSQWPIALFYIGIGLFITLVPLGFKPQHWPLWTDTVPLLSGLLIMLAGIMLVWLNFSQAIKAAAGVTLATAVMVLAITFGPIHSARVVYDMGNIGRLLALLQWGDRPVAILGQYRGEFTFTGRLWQPVLTLEQGELQDWVRAYPDGFTVVMEKELCPEWDDRAIYFSDYRSGRIWVFENLELLLFGLDTEGCGLMENEQPT